MPYPGSVPKVCPRVTKAPLCVLLALKTWRALRARVRGLRAGVREVYRHPNLSLALTLSYRKPWRAQVLPACGRPYQNRTSMPTMPTMLLHAPLCPPCHHVYVHPPCHPRCIHLLRMQAHAQQYTPVCMCSDIRVGAKGRGRKAWSPYV